MNGWRVVQGSLVAALICLLIVHFFRLNRQQKLEFFFQFLGEFIGQIVIPGLLCLGLLWLLIKGCI